MATESNGRKPKFSLGRIFGTPGVVAALAASCQTISEFLDRHVHGDWGELSEFDRHANEEALKEGSRILSAYQTSLGEKIWVITEALGDDGKRASTCLVLPEEY